MKKLILILILISTVSCIGNHRVDVWKTLTIASGDSIIINKVKSPATLSIKNISDKEVEMVSELKMQKSISANSEFTYRLPKKSNLILKNKNAEMVSIHLHYSSNKPILINHKELR
ncbi:hypothetical protein [Epilithonimonas zeae]|uniref:hypothetical protein n=1 Tax=Epilithonimonas zeae TaxID=1416779 RepID=UPI00200DDDFF|nr:hypothetical protein [Epilithonimonas zeae]UQB67542.1 hypothetical protein KI430_10875 [Epilithonimonas zeae]